MNQSISCSETSGPGAGRGPESAQGAFRELCFEDVAHEFHSGGRVPTLGGVSFTVREGEFLTVVGPSGCGKSTLFNLATGFLRPTSGRVLLNGAPLENINPYVAYMFQQPALLDWRTVLENVMLGQEFLRRPKAEARAEALKGLTQFGLDAFERRHPWELSGGMKQRVALLRTYLTRRNLLLLDEPFGAVDALTRLRMQQFLLDTWQEDRRTVLFITHDVDEALLLGDRVLVLSPRPARVRTVIEVTFPRPRNAGEMVSDASFVDLKKQLLELLQTDSDASERGVS